MKKTLLATTALIALAQAAHADNNSFFEGTIKTPLPTTTYISSTAATSTDVDASRKTTIHVEGSINNSLTITLSANGNVISKSTIGANTTGLNIDLPAPLTFNNVGIAPATGNAGSISATIAQSR